MKNNQNWLVNNEMEQFVNHKMEQFVNNKIEQVPQDLKEFVCGVCHKQFKKKYNLQVSWNVRIIHVVNLDVFVIVQFYLDIETPSMPQCLCQMSKVHLYAKDNICN